MIRTYAVALDVPRVDPITRTPLEAEAIALNLEGLLRRSVYFEQMLRRGSAIYWTENGSARRIHLDLEAGGTYSATM